MFVFPWDWAVQLVVAAVAAALALLVLRADPRKPANQFFALFMLLIAGNFLADFVAKGFDLGGDVRTQHLLERVAYQFLLFDPAAMVYFAMLYPRRDPRLDRPLVLGLIAAPTLLLTALHLVVPGVFVEPPGSGEGSLGGLRPWFRGLVELYLACFYLASFTLLLRHFAREDSPIFRSQFTLFLAGFGVAILPRISLAAEQSPLSPLLSHPWNIVARVTPPVALFAAYWIYARRLVPPARLPEMRRPFALMGVMVGLTVAVLVLASLDLGAVLPAANFMSRLTYSFRWIIFGSVVGYALLRYQVFDVELRTKRWTRRAAALAGFGAAALLAGLLVASVAPGNTLALAGSEAVLLAAFALPILRSADRLASKVFPGASQDSDYLYARKVEVYRANLEEALADGVIDPSEAAFLADLRRSLGISDREHLVIEHMVRARTRGVGPERLEPGKVVLGKYEVLKPLSAGAFGRATLARDRSLDRTVVLKELLPVWRGDPRMRDTLLAEARTAARLNHPHIVTVHEVERVGDEVFIVMEYCEGGSLEELLGRRGALSPEEVARLGGEMLDGIAAAHAKGVVHRDLKPSNLLLGADGRLKVADFGIARTLDRDTALRLSVTGSQPGTVAYMSPEQVEGKAVDARSDLYSAAVVLYRMATGKHYLDLRGAGDFEARRRILEAYPRLPAKGLPPWMSEFLARGLAKRPEQRFQSAEEMKRALLEPSQAPPLGVRGSTTRRVRRP